LPGAQLVVVLEAVDRGSEAEAGSEVAMTRSVLAVDPGPRSHGVVLFDGQRVIESRDMTTEELRCYIQWLATDDPPAIACEWIASYGMPVGKEVFETVLQIGMLRAITPMRLIPRADIKLHLCGSMRAKDANIRQALLDKLGPVGTKKNPKSLRLIHLRREKNLLRWVAWTQNHENNT
jgi:hypothetical protein